ncbi:hypothetical protein QQX98_001762 [Neonectria punicea]|uniref:Nephrocystin 3-like N-terminal domain-containing protein n=1 Tax=Neonectria punicea TaxID=979145 RepID=A0ABR1HN23_9HYPO
MAEAVFGAIEIAAVITEVVKLLHTYINEVKDARDDVRKLTQELFALKGALEHFDIHRKADIEKNRLGKPRTTTFEKAAERLSWPFRNREIQKHLDTIERAKAWFVMVILKDSSETTLAVYDEVKALVQILHKDMIEKETTKMIQETDDILTWLAPVDVEEMLGKATQNKVAGTGQWVLDKTFFQWLEFPDIKQPMFWITGKSGSGKTVLFSTIKDEVQTICSTDLSANLNLGYHCCSLDDAASQEIPNIFGSILAKAGSSKPEILEHIAPYKRSDNWLVPQNNLTISQINEIMAHILKSCDRFYILIDALNETPHEQELVQALLHLCEQHPQISVLVTCARKPLIRSPAIRERDMNTGAVDSDIEAYVLHRLAKDPCFYVLSVNIRTEIQRKIVSEADGMTLTLDELAEAVVLRESDTYIDDDCRLTNPIIIVDIFRDLVVRNPPFMTLAHDSIRTSLTSAHIRSTPAAFFALDAASAHSRILRKSLCYLRLDAFASGPISGIEAFNQRFELYLLNSYIAAYWPIHTERYELTSYDESLILVFFDTKKLQNGSSFGSWVQMLLHTQYLEPIRRTQPLYYASSFNMLSVIRLLLCPELGVDLNHPGGRFGSPPLFVAIWRGNIEAAKLLLEAGADPHYVDAGSFETSQDLAERFQMTEILQAIEEWTVRSPQKDEKMMIRFWIDKNRQLRLQTYK